ncbi:MAG: DNA recombination protein RmuC, partial [Longicatena sp.]
MEYVMYICIAAVAVLLIVLIIAMRPSVNKKNEVKELLLESEKRQQEALFQTQRSMNEVLMQFQSQMSNTMKQDLQQLNETTTRHLYTIQKDVNENMTHGYDQTSKVFTQVLQRMGKLDESQQNLKELSLSITHLQSILTDKKTRGIFGEIELYSLLEVAMGVDTSRYQKQYKLSNGYIADAVVFASEPLRMICIDSKFPLENYNRILQDQITSEERKRVQTIFLSDVKKHIKTIAEKYIIQHETAEFAYMFIPAEAIFSYLH